MALIYLAMAIIAEIAGTIALKASEGFTKLVPSLIVIVGYGLAIYLLTLVLRTIPVGITYAVWAGVGIVLVALVGSILYKQIPDLPAAIGMGPMGENDGWIILRLCFYTNNTSWLPQI